MIFAFVYIYFNTKNIEFFLMLFMLKQTYS